ncbi:MAG TPA: MFS transporter [Microvirga sp.]|jgi:PPP family 3-phenylpropionic acid transporter|nr:MFS transporter [Microvirga sp.]
MNAPRASGARLSALHAATFAGIGFYLPFFPVWLQSKAMSPGLIGVMVAIPIVVRILVTAPLMSLADRRLGLRPLLLAGHGAQVIGYPLLMVADDPFVIAGLVAALAVAQSPIVPANDLATIEAVRRNPRFDYGRLRVWGSIAFLAANIAAGYLVGALGADVVIWALLLTPLAGILATLLALPGRHTTPAAKPSATEVRARLPAVFFVVVLGAAMVQGSHGAIYAFGSIHWRSVGFSDSLIGYFWAIGVLAEIVVFFLLGRGVGRGSAGVGLILVGGAAAIVRHACLSLTPGLVPTLALQALHGLSFGATHLGTMAAIAALAPETQRGRAQGLGGSLIALAMAGTTVASGPLYRAFGPAVFAAMVPLCALGIALVLLGARMMRAQPQRAGEGG